MARRRSLKRLLRGPHRRVLEGMAALVPGPFSIEDAAGQVVFGEGGGEARLPVRWDGEVIGAVRGGPEAERVIELLAYFAEREGEKRALADETLGRYKELTLLYELSDTLSRVLDVDEVARRIVEEALRFVNATGAALLMHDRRRDRLATLAAAGAPGEPPEGLTLEACVEGRVLRSGRAEFVDGDAGGARGSVMCAPLRSGESVFGLLRVTNTAPDRWTAGDLKLVTAVAGHAAAALSHATLHREQLRQQALRGQIERFVSPRVVDAALEGLDAPEAEPLAVLFCDLGHMAHALSATPPGEALVEALVRARAEALDVLMNHDATVNVAHGEMLVALFPRRDGFEAGALDACRAGAALIGRLADGGEAPGALDARGTGVGVAATEPAAGDESEGFLAAVSRAAALQAAAEGRLLVEATVATALGSALSCRATEPVPSPRGPVEVYEVMR